MLKGNRSIPLKPESANLLRLKYPTGPSGVSKVDLAPKVFLKTAILPPISANLFMTKKTLKNIKKITLQPFAIDLETGYHFFILDKIL